MVLFPNVQMYTKGYTTKGIQMNSCILTVYGQNLHIPPITNIITFIIVVSRRVRECFADVELYRRPLPTLLPFVPLHYPSAIFLRVSSLLTASPFDLLLPMTQPF
jgi:hypothetical protein